VAAYRFGHSQARPSYRANFGTSGTNVSQQFFALLFDPTAVDQAYHFYRARRHAITDGEPARCGVRETKEGQ